MKAATELDRELTIYGIAIHKSGECYQFNREYLVLPDRPTQAEVEAIKLRHDQVTHGRAYGKGRFKPAVGNEREWTTYWVDLPEPMEWFNLDYPQDRYK